MIRTTAGPILFTVFVIICIAASVAMPSLRAASRAMNSCAHRQWAAYRQWTTKRRIVIGVAAVFVLLILIQWCLEQWLTYQAPTATATKEHFWIAVLLGKWSPASVPYSSRNFWSSLAVGIAVLLNVGFYAALLDLWRRVRKESTMRMQLTTGLHVRDEIAKREIYQSQTFKSLSEGDQEKLEALLNEAFNRADVEWRKIFASPKTIDEVTLG